MKIMIFYENYGKEKECSEGEFELNYEAAKSIKERRFPLQNLNKLHFFSTLDDRTITPSSDLAIELMEYFLGDLPNCHVEHFHSGHLAGNSILCFREKSKF